MSFQESGITSADMYDEDVKRIATMYQQLMLMYSKKPNDHFHVSEMAKRATDDAFKMGYVVRVHTSGCLLGVEPPTIEIVGRVPGHEFNQYGMDHARKRYEVNRAVTRNEEGRMRQQIKAIEPPARPPK